MSGPFSYIPASNGARDENLARGCEAISYALLSFSPRHSSLFLFFVSSGTRDPLSNADMSKASKSRGGAAKKTQSKKLQTSTEHIMALRSALYDETGSDRNVLENLKVGDDASGREKRERCRIWESYLRLCRGESRGCAWSLTRLLLTAHRTHRTLGIHSVAHCTPPQLSQAFCQIDRNGIKATLTFHTKMPRRMLDQAVALSKEYVTVEKIDSVSQRTFPRL